MRRSCSDPLPAVFRKSRRTLVAPRHRSGPRKWSRAPSGSSYIYEYHALRSPAVSPRNRYVVPCSFGRADGHLPEDAANCALRSSRPFVGHCCWLLHGSSPGARRRRRQVGRSSGRREGNVRLGPVRTADHFHSYAPATKRTGRRRRPTFCTTQRHGREDLPESHG